MGLRVEWFDRDSTWVSSHAGGVRIGEHKVDDGKVAVLFSNGEQGAAVQGSRLEILEMLREGLRQVADLPADWTPTYEPWRHGGWYVTNVRYPSGAVGCVSRNYTDRKWRIVCEPGSYPGSPTDRTFPSRDAAAHAERELAASQPEKVEVKG
jgi:hypothetical protein